MRKRKEDEEKGKENFQDLSPIPFKERSLFILKMRHSDTWKLRCSATQSGKYHMFCSEIEDLAVGGRTKAVWLGVSGGRRIDKAVALSMTS